MSERPVRLLVIAATTVAGVVGAAVATFASGSLGFFTALSSMVLAVVVARRLARRTRP